MIIKSEFKVDLFQLKHTRNPEELVKALRTSYAREMGLKIEELFPYTRIEEQSFKGELPAMSLNRDHEFTDLYRTEFMIIGAESIQRKIRELEAEAEELIQERDDEQAANLKLAQAEILRNLLIN